MKITEVAFVGYPVTDINRAREFYGRVLGLCPGAVDHELEGQPGRYWVEYDVGNVTLAISNAWAPSGQGGPTVAFEVEDLVAAVARVRDFGVEIVAEHIETAVCRFALVSDPDGNEILLHQRKAGCHH